MKQLMCEACNRAPAKLEDILCEDCSHYYMIMLDLLAEDPEALEKLKEVFDWRMKKAQTVSY